VSPSIAYIGVILIWSTTPLAIKWSTDGAGFSFAVASRMAIGLALALLVLAALRIRMPWNRRARLSYLVSGLSQFGAMTLTYWGSQYIHSGLVSLLFGLAPLVTGILAVLYLNEAALSANKILGMILGLFGLAVIFWGGHELGGAHAVAGVAALLAAVLVYASGIVLLKRIADDSPPMATTTGALIVALPLYLLVWAWSDGGVPGAIPTLAGLSILYLALFGSVLGFAFYYHVIKHMDAGKVSLITLITPVLALILGNTLNGEVLSAQVLGGALLITLGLVLHQWTNLSGLLVAVRD
jgi:drug/metabolite transporter (DMT)-like permease